MFTPDGRESSRGRSVDFELNLVPFIDLMSTCISFLLITAVWTQVSMIQIGSSIYGKKTDTGQVEQPQHEQVNHMVPMARTSMGKKSVDIQAVFPTLTP